MQTDMTRDSQRMCAIFSTLTGMHTKRVYVLIKYIRCI